MIMRATSDSASADQREVMADDLQAEAGVADEEGDCSGEHERDRHADPRRSPK
jgi:hypothetical protein